MKRIAVVLLLTQSLTAAEYAVLQTGFRLRAERHEVMGGTTRLFLPGGGSVDVISGEIAGFESEEYLPSQAASRQPGSLNEIIQASGEKHGLDPDLIRSVISAESGGNPLAVSHKGAAGLMQLMPKTARELRVDDVFNPAQNVDGGTGYLRSLLAQFGNDLTLALAAYNAGPQKVISYRGLPPYTETRAYVNRVITLFNQSKK